jgi:hypothetical protein
MPSSTVAALLSDAAGMILLVRRKRSALWRLPGGDVGPHASAAGMLVSLCRRQAGVAPEFVAPWFEFTIVGRRVLVAPAEIRHEQARACGWIEAVQWCRPDHLPVALDPAAAMAISLAEAGRVRAAARALVRSGHPAGH